MATQSQQTCGAPAIVEEKIVRRVRTVGGKLEHISKCNKGFGYVTNRWCAQIHHILPVSSLQRGHLNVPPNDIDFIDNCIKITDWNINEHYNTIGLPLKNAFYKLDENKYFTLPTAKDTWTVFDNWDGLPCHQVDHDLYTKDTYKKLKMLVWDKLKNESEDCKIDLVDAQTHFTNAAKFYHNILKNRGSGSNVGTPGTRQCWTNRLKKEYEDRWYKPFSMAPTGQIRKREAPPQNLSPSLVEKLGGIFKIIK